MCTKILTNVGLEIVTRVTCVQMSSELLAVLTAIENNFVFFGQLMHPARWRCILLCYKFTFVMLLYIIYSVILGDSMAHRLGLRLMAREVASLTLIAAVQQPCEAWQSWADSLHTVVVPRPTQLSITLRTSFDWEGKGRYCSFHS